MAQTIDAVLDHATAAQVRCMSPLGFEWSVVEATAGTFMDQLVHTWDHLDRRSGVRLQTTSPSRSVHGGPPWNKWAVARPSSDVPSDGRETDTNKKG